MKDVRSYLISFIVIIMAVLVSTTSTTVEASTTYTITPKSNTYDDEYKNYTSLNNYTKHYYVIRSYLEQLEKDGGGTLVLQRGDYTITNTLYVPSNVTIKLNNGVNIIKGTKTGKRVGSRAGEDNIKPSKSLFQFISPSKSTEKGIYGGYDGEKNISLIGSGTATIDLNNDKDSLAIIAGHNKNLLIENITFLNMNSGHFIEIDATNDAIIRNNKFMYSKPSKNFVKEAINIDTPDRSTLGWSSEWSKFDKTPNKNMLIENNYFYELDRAIGTHKYSGDEYHDKIIIRGNTIENTRNDAIRAMNWSNSIIEDNLIKDVDPSAGNNNRGILASGVINPMFQNNTFVNVPRAMQFFPWKNSGAGSQYDITYNELSNRNIEALKTNTIVNGEEDFIRINHVYGEYGKENSDWIYIKEELFYDLLKGESGYEETLELVDRGIITGYGDGTFKPFEEISRQHVAVMFYRALELEKPTNIKRALATVSDVSENHPYANEIAAVIEANIFMGSNNQFKPKDNITRGQMASVLVRAFNLKDRNKPVNIVDLQQIDPSHRKNVQILAQNNITVGKLNNKGERYFDADGYLNRVQFASLLYRSMEVGEIEFEEPEETINQFEEEVVKLTNVQREKHGLNPLKIDKKLSQVAKEKSRDMVLHDYFDHDSPTYGSPFDMMELFGIKYKSAAENIAYGYSTPEMVVDGWMNSPGHRENILNESFTHIGVGYMETNHVWTQQFIKK